MYIGLQIFLLVCMNMLM